MAKYRNIYIEITNKCNLTCSFCPKNTRTQKEITPQMFEEIVLKTKHKTQFYYLHVMGEPMLNSNFINILKIAENHNLKIKLVTNGTLINNYYGKLQTFNCVKKITFSLSCLTDFLSLDAVTYLDTVLHCAYFLLQNSSISINLRMISSISTPLKNLINEKIKEHLDEDINSQIKNPLYKNRLTYEITRPFIWPINSTSAPNNKTCLALKTQIAILSDGTVVPCCLDSEGKINLGNIFSNTLEEIENSDNFKKIKDNFSKNIASHSFCKTCTYKK